MFKSNEQNATDIRILANFIKKRLVDEKAEVVTYDELSNAIGGRDLRNRYRYILNKARKIVNQDCKIYIGTVNNVGISIVTDLAGAMDKTMSHINRTANQEIKKVMNALPDDLSNEQSVQTFARVSALGAMAVCTKRNSIKKIEGKLQETGMKELPTAETLRLFEK